MVGSAIGYSKPLLIIGNGARGLDWTKFGIPIVTTRLGIDLIESDNPLFAGRYGLFTDTPSYLAVKNASTITIVGARLDPGFAGYNFKDFAPQANLAIIDIDSNEVRKFNDGSQYSFTRNGKHVWIYKMSAQEAYKYALPGSFEDCPIEWLDQIHTWQKKYPLKLTGSYKVIREISDQATKDDVIVVDTSSSFHTAAQIWQIKKGQRYITTGGISTMGYWPAAIGAALASGRRVICITGDGCLQMNIQELATVVKNKLNIKIFVLNNDGYLLIRHTQKKYFGRLGGESSKTGLGFPNLRLISEAYGIGYYGIGMNKTQIILDKKVGELGLNVIYPEDQTLKNIINFALRDNAPVLCEIKTPRWEKSQGRLDSLMNMKLETY